MTRIFPGLDLVHIPKLSALMARHPAFLEDVFTEGERAFCLRVPQSARRLAGCFAAKEACLKALGLGLAPAGLHRALHDIELLPGNPGQPQVLLHGWAKRLGCKRGIVHSRVSISHFADYALAMVVLRGTDRHRLANEVP